MLEVKGLTKYYKGRSVLNNVSFAVSKGKVLGIVGPNGAGKSTLLRIISGIIDADSGETLTDGKSLAIRDSAYWGYLPEERGLYPQMLVLDQLIYFAVLKGMNGSAAKAKAIQLLKEWKMEHYLKVKASDLSKGNQQRIQFLCAILHDPTLIILDEPFSGLDPVQTDWLHAQIQQFRQQGKMVLYSSHRMDSVEALCDDVLVLHEGHKTAYGSSEELCRQGEETWQVTCTGGNESWYSIVHIIGTQRQENGQVIVRFELGTKKLSEVMKAIENSGASLEAIKRHKLSLHELFVQLTSGSHVA